MDLMDLTGWADKSMMISAQFLLREQMVCERVATGLTCHDMLPGR